MLRQTMTGVVVHADGVEIREVIAELPGAEIRDLHVWRVGQVQYAAVLSLRMAVPIPAQAIRERLAIHEELVHLTIEIAQG